MRMMFKENGDMVRPILRLASVSAALIPPSDHLRSPALRQPVALTGIEESISLASITSTLSACLQVPFGRRPQAHRCITHPSAARPPRPFILRVQDVQDAGLRLSRFSIPRPVPGRWPPICAQGHGEGRDADEQLPPGFPGAGHLEDACRESFLPAAPG